MNPDNPLTRREFLALAALGGLGVALTACVDKLAPVASPISTFVAPTPYHIPPAGLMKDPLAGLALTPTATDVPTVTPVEVSAISDPEFESLATNQLATIFRTAYSVRGNGKWTDNRVNQRLIQSLEEQFTSLFGPSSNPLREAIRKTADQLRQANLEPDEKKRSPLFYFEGKFYSDQYLYILKAIKLLYEKKGYAVEYTPQIQPPTMTIIKKGYFDKRTQRDQVLGIPLARGREVSRYVIRDTGNQAILFDSLPLLGLVHGTGEAHIFDEGEYFLWQSGINAHIDSLVSVRNTGRSPKAEENPPDDNKSAKNMMATVQRMLKKIPGDIGTLKNKDIDFHERAHLILPIIYATTDKEQRSLTAELGNSETGIPRLALATLLFSVSQRQYLERVITNTYYNEAGQGTIYPGAQETLAEVVWAIVNDPELKQKLSIDFSYSTNNESKTILPASIYKDDEVLQVLTRLDQLEDGDLNKIAKTLFSDSRFRHWFPPNLKPIIGLMTRQEFFEHVKNNPFGLLGVVLAGS